MKPRQFIDAIAPAARRTQATHGVPASVTIAQAALESAWGESRLAREGLNLFGIKADDSWHGATIDMPTREFRAGAWVDEAARWRKYDDWQGSIDDHAQFLRANPRYRPAFDHTDDAAAFAAAIAAAGYATDPAYTAKLITIIRAHDLAALDTLPATDQPQGDSESIGSHKPEQAGSTPAPATNDGDVHMIPLAFIPALADAAAEMLPEIGRILGDRSRGGTERGTAVAGKVLATIATATGAANEQAAIERMRADPAALEAARAAVRAQWYEIAEAGSGGIGAARDYDAAVMRADGPWWQIVRSPSFLVACLLLPLVYIIVLSLIGVMGNAQWSADVRAALAGTIVGTIVGGLVGYYYGQTTSRNRTQAPGQTPRVAG